MTKAQDTTDVVLLIEINPKDNQPQMALPPPLVAPFKQTELEVDQRSVDQVLLRGCQKGNPQAWEALLNKYERLVFSIPLNYGLSHDDAADITQLTFTILLRSLDKLDEDSHLGAWLATVARRHTWRLLERRRRESVNEAEDLTESESFQGQAASDFMNRWELLEWLDYGLTRIGGRCRRLLQALYFDPQQPSYAEVAADLEIPVGSVGPTRARCLERLRQILQKS
ncbi:MAG: sigma-70 family RNA polymerase sigma factor [Anaerolineae bacterium]